jgi:hypothetical protein
LNFCAQNLRKGEGKCNRKNVTLFSVSAQQALSIKHTPSCVVFF